MPSWKVKLLFMERSNLHSIFPDKLQIKSFITSVQDVRCNRNYEIAIVLIARYFIFSIYFVVVVVFIVSIYFVFPN